MKLYYVANARMPTEKAHGIQIAKMCEAFIEAGISLTLVVPSRGTVAQSVQEFYKLRLPVPIVRLPVLDLYIWGRFGYRVSSYIFMAESVVFLLWKKIKGYSFIVYTVDLDNFSSSALPLAGMPIFSEMHGGKPNTFAQRLLFRFASGIIAINSIIIEELKKSFPSSPARYCVESNGVDDASFVTTDKKEARKQLGLPQDERIVLYAGRFFDWKGLEILPHAALLAPYIQWYIVGGDKKQFKDLVGGFLTDNMHFEGSRPHDEMRLWYSAADALVVLGTKRDTQSYFYTSPMKLFEYMLSRRPIIASATPAIRQVVSETEALFYESDNAKDLADKVAYAIGHDALAEARMTAAEIKGRQMSWKARAERIKKFMK